MEGHTLSYQARRRAVGYHCWYNMVRRITDETHMRYPDYCHLEIHDPWTCPATGFEAFLAHIGPRPSLDHQIDRIDNAKGYLPGNVRWATLEEQQNNRSVCRFVEHSGERLTYTQWSRRLGAGPGLVWSRITRGWDPIRAVTTPVRRKPHDRSRHGSLGSALTGDLRHPVPDQPGA